MAIFETRRRIDTAVAEARADPIVSRPGEWDFDPGFDREAIVRRPSRRSRDWRPNARRSFC